MLCIKIHIYIFLSRILRATEGPRLLCTAPTAGSRTARTGAPLPLFSAHGGSRPRCATLGSIGAFRPGFVPWRYIFLSFYCYGFAPLPLARIRVPVGSMGSGARHYRITKETFLFLSRLRTDTAERCRISEGFVLFHFILLEQRNGSACFNSFSRITGAVLKNLFFIFYFFSSRKGNFFSPGERDPAAGGAAVISVSADGSKRSPTAPPWQQQWLRRTAGEGSGRLTEGLAVSPRGGGERREWHETYTTVK